MKIKNWDKFQHFKDRRPPWIKLHREILEQRDINLISDRSFRILVCLWLLASEDDTKKGLLPPVEDIAFRLRMDKSKIIKALEELKPFVEQDDIKTISERNQVDDPETETETETEESRRKFTPPEKHEVIQYFLENNYTTEAGAKAFDYYHEGKWKDSEGKPVKNWKQKMRGVWFKPEHKQPTQQQRHPSLQ